MAIIKEKSSRLVYSSESGRICPECEQPVDRCKCRGKERTAVGDGIVRVGLEKKGRGGKTVTTITGIPLSGDELKQVASDLKKRCGTGGALKDAVIEIQGDHRDSIVAELVLRGYKVKKSGG
jgi:translation initiation factor 1